MEKYLVSQGIKKESPHTSLLDEKILAYFNLIGCNKTMQETYKSCIGDNYIASDFQKKRLLSYLIIKKDKLTLDLVLKQANINTDFKSKNIIFNSFVEKGLITSKNLGNLKYKGTMEQNLEILHLLVQESYFDGIESNTKKIKLDTENKLFYLGLE